MKRHTMRFMARRPAHVRALTSRTNVFIIKPPLAPMASSPVMTQPHGGLDPHGSLSPTPERVNAAQSGGKVGPMTRLPWRARTHRTAWGQDELRHRVPVAGAAWRTTEGNRRLGAPTPCGAETAACLLAPRHGRAPGSDRDAIAAQNGERTTRPPAGKHFTWHGIPRILSWLYLRLTLLIRNGILNGGNRSFRS